MMNNNGSKNNNRYDRYDRLYHARQKLFRLYDIESMSEHQIRNLKLMYEIFKEYDLKVDLDNLTNGNTNELLNVLYKIKEDIDAKIANSSNSSSSSNNSSSSSKGYLVSKLDNLLTLIAIVESSNKNALQKILVTNGLIDEGILEGNIKDNIKRKKDELERLIIELKKEYNQ